MVSVELSRLVLHSILSSASACASSPSANATAGLSCLDDIDNKDGQDKIEPGCEYGSQPGENRRAGKEETRGHLNRHKLSNGSCLV